MYIRVRTHNNERVYIRASEQLGNKSSSLASVRDCIVILPRAAQITLQKAREQPCMRRAADEGLIS